MKIIFSGTPEFSILTLEYIHKNYDLKAVITRPDIPAGRGRKITSPPVKEYAISHKIQCFQPNNLKDPGFIKDISMLEPDFIIDLSYGRIMPEEILSIPNKACINIHPSLLPGYKGPSPIRWVLINGEDVTGVSTHIMTCKIDEGRIIYNEKIDLSPEVTYDSLYEELSRLCVKTVKMSIDKFLKNEFTDNVKDIYKTKNFYTKKLDKKDFYIDWNRSSASINNIIKASNSRPADHTVYNNTPLKIYSAEIMNDYSANETFQPGEVVSAERNNGIIIKTGNGFLKIIRLQKQNKKILNYRDFLNGTKLNIKEKFER